jgi:hypothetical protein
VQAVVIDRFGAKTELFWYPYTEKKARLVRKVINFLYKSPIGKLLGN